MYTDETIELILSIFDETEDLFVLHSVLMAAASNPRALALEIIDKTADSLRLISSMTILSWWGLKRFATNFLL